MVAGVFDETLEKYKPSSINKSNRLLSLQISLFIQAKEKQVYHRTLEKYEATGKQMLEYFGDIPIAQIDVIKAEGFAAWLKQERRLADITHKERLTCAAAIWEAAIADGVIESNPWPGLKKQVKVAPKQAPKPFTKDEIVLIIEGFQSDRHYSHYTDFVCFLFGTGVRTGEAIGLQWQHVSEDCSHVWIGESISRGVQKTTKTNKDRTVPLTPKLRELMRHRKPQVTEPGGLVFPSPKGLPIDDHNFRNRAWVAVLKKVGVPYRKPYNTRHTFISHCLESGMNPAVVSQITGHNLETLFKNYAGVVNSKPVVPEFFCGSYV